MKIALVGWGIETKSAYAYYGPEHTYLIVSEEPRDDFPTATNVTIQTLKEHRKPGLTGNVENLDYLKGIEEYEFIIFTPVARKNLEIIYDESHDIWNKAVSTVQIFFEDCPSKNVIGATGTKGKGTTTTLIGKMIEANNMTVHIGGNIGIPVLELLPKIKKEDWVVLELSSFQLYKFPFSPHIAVHLMMIPEHIDEWHHTMYDYVGSKRNIFANQKSDDVAVYNPYNVHSAANVEASAGKHIPYLQSPGAHVVGEQIMIDDTVIIEVSDIALLGKHNIENVCAAVTATWQVHQNLDAYRNVLRSFTGLEHRLQLIHELNGVKYYDDSFGTTPDTSIVAMNAFSEPKIMIVGGHDKGNDFSDMINRLFNDDIKGIVCLGPTGAFISSKLLEMGLDSNKIISKQNHNDWTMEEIVRGANKFAESGDVILLSTGSASFGIFKDYKDRGNQFINVVNSL